MPAITITRAAPEDIARALPLLTAQLDDHGIPIPRDILESALRGIITRPDRGAVLLARRDTEAVGLAVIPYTWTVEHGGPCAWLDELYVVPEWRARGIGTLLLTAAMDLAREDGCLAIDLEVDIDHSRVEALYLRHGFHTLPRRRFSRRLQ
jgi:GNAT superfamily N-acetyltransferase